MTDVTGGRGGVGIRLFVTGGEVVKRTFDQVGDSGKKMWAQIALGEKSTNPAFRALSAGANEVKQGIGGLADSTGAFGRSLGVLGVAGVTFAAVMGAVAIAVTKAKEAMAFADEIDDAAEALAIGTDALQEYRAAMIAAGGDATDADTAIDKFNKKLGEAQSGLGRGAMKPFAALGFTREDLNSFDSGEEALAEVARRVADLSKESERAAVAEKLGLGPMLPLLRRGADGIADMRQEARDLGLVMDEALIKKGAAANQQLEEISGTIRVQMMEAFAGLSDEVVTFTKSIADALTGLNQFIGRYNDWKDRAEAAGELPDETEQGALRFGAPGALFAVARNRLRVGLDRLTGRRPSEEAIDMYVANKRQAHEPLPGEPPAAADDEADDNRLVRPPGSSSSRTSDAEREAERLLRDRERALSQLDRDAARAERDAVRARHSGDTADERLALARELLRLDKEERDLQRAALAAELERTGATDEATALQLQALADLDAEAQALAERAATEEYRKTLAQEALARDQAREDDALALLDIEAQLATTRQEQYAIERRILLLRQAAEQRALDAELNEEVAAGRMTQAEADARRGSAAYRGRLEVGLFDDQERERARAEFRSFGHDIIDGVKSGKLGQQIAEELQARLMDMALNGLFDFLNPRGPDGQAYGGQGGGGGGFWSTAFNAIAAAFGGGGQGPGRAGGGPLWSGYRHPVAETGRPELMMIGGNGHVTDAVTTKRMLEDLVATERGGANGGRMESAQTLIVQVDKSEYFDVAVRTAAAPAIQAGEARAVGTALNASRRGAPGLQARLRQLGTT